MQQMLQLCGATAAGNQKKKLASFAIQMGNVEVEILETTDREKKRLGNSQFLLASAVGNWIELDQCVADFPKESVCEFIPVN